MSCIYCRNQETGWHSADTHIIKHVRRCAVRGPRHVALSEPHLDRLRIEYRSFEGPMLAFLKAYRSFVLRRNALFVVVKRLIGVDYLPKEVVMMIFEREISEAVYGDSWWPFTETMDRRFYYNS